MVSDAHVNVPDKGCVSTPRRAGYWGLSCADFNTLRVHRAILLACSGKSATADFILPTS